MFALALLSVALAQLKWDHQILPDSTPSTNLAMGWSEHGKQLAALGRDGQVWHIYEKADGVWTNWTQLTSICPWKNDTQRVCEFSGNPAIGVNRDGRFEIFVQFKANLDVWQLYQTDPADPTKWTVPRESSCVDQDQHTSIWFCLGDAPFVSFDHYWIGSSPVFPTSDLTVMNDPKDGRIVMFYRGFTGTMFQVQQVVAGNSSAYTVPKQVGDTIIEATMANQVIV